jgi:hypothetical protein
MVTVPMPRHPDDIDLSWEQVRDALRALEGSRVAVRVVERSDPEMLLAVFTGTLGVFDHAKHPALFWPVCLSGAPEPAAAQDATIHFQQTATTYCARQLPSSFVCEEDLADGTICTFQVLVSHEGTQAQVLGLPDNQENWIGSTAPSSSHPNAEIAEQLFRSVPRSPCADRSLLIGPRRRSGGGQPRCQETAAKRSATVPQSTTFHHASM